MAKDSTLKSKAVLIAIVCIILVLGYFSVFAAGGTVYLPIIIGQAQSTPLPTNIQTLTPAPTETEVPTETIVPTETTNVTILQNHFTYISSSDNQLHVVGEILNNSESILRYPEVIAIFFDGNGQQIAKGFVYTRLQFISTNDKTCFNISLPVPSGWSYYQLDTQVDMIYEGSLPNLTILNQIGSYNSSLGWYEITGQVRNDGGNQVNYVTPVATLYDNNGTVIGCGFTFVDSNNLNPGQTSSFKINFLGRDYFDVGSYRLQVSQSGP